MISRHIPVCRPALAAVALTLTLLAAAAIPAAAQDPPPRPIPVPVPVPQDTTRPAPIPGREPVEQPDTGAAAVLALDTIPARPAVPFPAMPVGPAVGFGAGVWVWDREALLREAPVSLIDLLDRIPAVTALRSGMFAQPEVAGGFGGTATRIEIARDGFILDPIAGSSYDLSQIPIGQLTEVRVERRLGLLRIHLRTEEPQDTLPYTRVEAGIGEPDANLFRGLFMAPHVIVGPLALGIERVDTEGLNGTQPATIFSGWGKWTWSTDRRGIQLELLRSTLERRPESPFPLERVRQEIVLRARNRFTDHLTAEVYGGVTQFEETPFIDDDEPEPEPDPDDPDAPEEPVPGALERDVVQAGIRASYALPWGVLSGTFRYRDRAPLPTTEGILQADLDFGRLAVSGELGQASWEDRDATSYSSVRGEIGPFLKAAIYGEMTQGDRGAPVWTDTTSVITSRSGYRAGLTVDLGRAVGSIGYVTMEGDWSRPFGLAFDSAGIPLATAQAKGLEAFGRFTIIRDWLAIESWITDWQQADGWVYLPSRSWRTALELHALPLPSGNLEILARVEGHQRGGMLAYPVERPEEGDEEALPFEILPSFTTFGGYLQIRVIDVRAFIRWEDIMGNEIEVLPGVIRQGPRIFYGVKWNLWN